MATTRQPSPPLIVKAGNYTVFITNPNRNSSSCLKKEAPPLQFEKRTTSWSLANRLGLNKGAVSRFRNVHLILDEYLAGWLGLNESKYQWALNDYNGIDTIGKRSSN